jgi:hypothetical protein
MIGNSDGLDANGRAAGKASHAPGGMTTSAARVLNTGPEAEAAQAIAAAVAAAPPPSGPPKAFRGLSQVRQGQGTVCFSPHGSTHFCGICLCLEQKQLLGFQGFACDKI